MTSLDDLITFVEAYRECALWSSTDPETQQPLDEDHDDDDIADETRAEMMQDCIDFVMANAEDLAGIDAAQAGHDFWLTRNSHGAGFWDRGLGEKGERLSKAAKGYGEVDLWVDADGKVRSN